VKRPGRVRPSGPGPPARLVVGRVVRPHGIRGEVLVEVLSDAPDRFAPGAAMAAGDPEAPTALRPLTIAASRLHQGRLLARFGGLDDRTAVEPLRGALLSVPTDQARPLADGEYWSHQLVGLTVVDPTGRRRGEVAAVEPGTAHDLLAIRLESGGGTLVPAVAALVTVELDAGRVIVADLPGLLDPER
jgi:16S rRNA processing protein RimM